MPDSALYFPYMDVPRSDSIWAVLLYWDRLGTIAPDRARPLLSGWTQSLIDAGLVEAITPERHLSHRIASGFLDLVDALPSRRPVSAPVFLHIDKANYELWWELRARGLAQAEHEDGPRSAFAVDGHVGRLYLAYLATVLGQLPEFDMEPVTDQPRYFHEVANPGALGSALELDRIRATILRDVLPSPRGAVDPVKLYKFKDKHRSLLLGFRREVEQAAIDAALHGEAAMRDRAARAAAARFRDQADEIDRMLRERRWPTAAGSLCALLGGLPGVAGGLVTGHPEVAAAAATAPLIAEFVRNRFGNENAPSATTYAVLARNEFRPEPTLDRPPRSCA